MKRQFRPGRNIDDRKDKFYDNNNCDNRIFMLDQIDDNSDDISKCFPMDLKFELFIAR